MGKHSAPESPGFWRAVIIAGFRYLLILALIGAVGFGIYRLVFDRGDNDATADEEELSAVPTDPFLEETPLEDPATSPPPPSPTAAVTGRTQVLDASSSPARLDSAAQKLTDAGHEVVYKGPAATPRERTTVFYQPGHQQLGEAVAGVLGASMIQPAEDLNVDRNIPVTVILGPDYAG